MDKRFAENAKNLALEAVKNLNEIVKFSDRWQEDEMKDIHRSIGKTIGKIEIDILSKIYVHFPELDDLAE